MSPVVVIGAGLAGLTLARILQRGGVEVAVHDLDASPAARAQGGMLDMHEESGQAALRAAGLHDAFLAEVLPGGEAMRILDARGLVRLDEGDNGDGGRPEIRRETLRALLLDSLDAGTVRWGSKLVAAEPAGGGRHTLTFADGTTQSTGVLVGADGAWSRVRSLVSDARPAYSGITMFTTRLHDADARHPGAAAVVGGGIMFALGDGKGLIAHREPDAVLEVYAAARMPLDAVAQADARVLADHFTGWADALRALVTDADEPFVPRPIHMLPVGHRWERTPGTTLLGDAAHLMSPFAGEGANLAMRDGADLAAALLAHGVAEPAAVEAALAEYEATMVPRAATAAAESAENLEIAFRADAPDGLLDLMAAHTA